MSRAIAGVRLCLPSCSPSARRSSSFQDEAIAVEPASSRRRTDLVGKKVALDDHVAYYVPRTGRRSR